MADVRLRLEPSTRKRGLTGISGSNVAVSLRVLLEGLSVCLLFCRKNHIGANGWSIALLQKDCFVNMAASFAAKLNEDDISGASL